MSTLIFDLETDGLLSEVTKVHCMVILEVETGTVHRFTNAEMPEGLKVLDTASVQVSHNGVRFDYPVLRKLYGYEPKCVVRDTLVMAKLIWPNLKVLDKGSTKLPGNLVGSHSLKAWGLRLGVLKGDFGDTNDWATFTPEMLEYCVNDVTGPTRALWDLIVKKAPSPEAVQVEHDFTYVMFLMEQHGFRFDEAAAHKLHSTLVKRRLELEEQLQATFGGWSEDMKTPEYWTAVISLNGLVAATFKAPTKGDAEKMAWRDAKKIGARRKDISFTPGPMAKKHTPFNPASRDHIARVLSARGWKPSKFTDGGKPQIDESVLEGLKFPEAKLLLEYLMLEKRLGQLAEGDNAWLKLVKDGRIHGRIDSMGTVTSRCSHNHPNMAQVPAVAVGKDKKPLLGGEGRYGYECRSLFLPDEGHVLVGADASGIQLRVIAHYMARWDEGQYAALVTKGDVHTANKEAAGLPTRDMAKTFAYAFLLGAGDAKIGQIVGKNAAAGRELKERFLETFPALAALKAALKHAVNERGSIRGLDGRVMPCESAHLAMGALLQGFEAVVMKKATWFLYQDLTARGWVHGVDWGLCAFVHDEYQITSRKEIAHDVGKAAVAAIVRAGDFFGSRCGLAGEYKVGGNWAETH